MRAAISLGACVLASCSLFVSLDDLNDGSADGGAGIDGSIDGNGSDVINQSDVLAVDAGDGGDAACSGFCDNFDDRTTPQGQWDDYNQSGNGVLTDMSITTDEFVSAPHSLHAHMPARASGGADAVYLSKQFPLTNGQMSIDFDMKVVGAMSGFTGFANLMELNLGGDYAGSITAGGDGDTVVDYWVNFPDGGHIQPLFDLGATGSGWHHFHYAALYDDTNGSILVTEDGNTYGNVTATVTYGLSPVPTSFIMTIGYTSQATLPVMDIYFDNVQVQ
jgi:hypothetical protein